MASSFAAKGLESGAGPLKLSGLEAAGGKKGLGVAFKELFNDPEQVGTLMETLGSSLVGAAAIAGKEHPEQRSQHAFPASQRQQRQSPQFNISNFLSAISGGGRV
jgi:hypothetical protein